MHSFREVKGLTSFFNSLLFSIVRLDFFLLDFPFIDSSVGLLTAFLASFLLNYLGSSLLMSKGPVLMMVDLLLFPSPPLVT